MKQRTIHGDGVSLEPINRSHAPEMFTVLSDHAIYEFIDGAPPASVEQLADRYAQLESGLSPDGTMLWLNWVVAVPGKGYVGYVQATVHSDRTAEVAFVLGSSDWSFGYATAAMEAMLTKLAVSYDVRGLFARVDRANQRSLRLLNKLGFIISDVRSNRHVAVASNEVLTVRQ
jgi:[ribosomal protein S5]-alanine N-acetyltransferase